MPLTLHQHKTLRGNARPHSSLQRSAPRAPQQQHSIDHITAHNRRINDISNALAALIIIGLIAAGYWVTNDVPPEQRITSSEAARR